MSLACMAQFQVYLAHLLAEVTPQPPQPPQPPHPPQMLALAREDNFPLNPPTRLNRPARRQQPLPLR